MSDAYFLEIEAHFAARRGTPFILSAKDWALMKKWHDDAVPLPVVIEAIDTVFEKNETSGRRKIISSLSYCRHAVKELWEDRKTLYVREAEATPEGAPEALLEALAQRIEATELGAPFAPRVRALSAEKSVPKIETALVDLEGELLDTAMAADPAAVAEIRAEIAATLGDTSRIDEKTRARTIEANLRRLVRERFGLPRLTLFSQGRAAARPAPLVSGALVSDTLVSGTLVSGALLRAPTFTARSTCSITPAAVRPLTGRSPPASDGSVMAHAARTREGSFCGTLRAHSAPRSASSRAATRVKAVAFSVAPGLTRRVTGSTP